MDRRDKSRGAPKTQMNTDKLNDWAKYVGNDLHSHWYCCDQMVCGNEFT